MLPISERKKPLTDYGKQINIKLMELNKTQEWLIAKIKELYPDVYVDSSNLYKIKIGGINSGKVISAINEILEISQKRP